MDLALLLTTLAIVQKGDFTAEPGVHAEGPV